ncbi:hypothetical protein KGQ19_47595 [Catenulispora sp. NL8]|uniref:ParB/Sulfiredoxin domain-containing protein n=1 Tax=Catenulispora pinistramenti TaxID=2705254 RepID=A0ABS5L893_9ACTN|nr:hypothetical protein [Catenulispora pinistramenti]MBS2554544.1 hypothetical protein [Catenulispora pinistramenti]
MTTTKTAALPKALAGITHEIIMITPAMAEQLLGYNDSNRGLRDGVTAAYARDLTAGRWDFNGETIKIADDGTLIDGQHRLEAIVRSGVAAPCLVVTGLPRTAQKTIDTGARRTFGDELGWRGEKHANTLAAVLRRIVLWEADYRLKAGRFRPSEAEMDAALEAHPDARNSAEFGDSKGSAAVLSASQMAFAHWLLTQRDAMSAAWFMDRLCDGIGLGPGHPVLALRDRIRRERDAHRGTIGAEIALALVITAWNAVRSGNSVSKIQLPKGGLSAESFPTPR